MTSLQIVFLLISLVTVVSGVMVVSVRRLMHAALWLVLTLLGVAMIFATLQANFFAVVQVLVYIGAIAILFIFALMLTYGAMTITGPKLNRGWAWALAAAGGLFAGLIAVLTTWDGFHAALTELPADAEGLAEFGEALVAPTGFAIPFEVASILLVAALIGAIYIAVERKVVEQ